MEAALVDWESTVECGGRAAVDTEPPEDEDEALQLGTKPVEAGTETAPPGTEAWLQHAALEPAPNMPLHRVLQDDRDCVRLPPPLRHLDQLRVVNTPTPGGQEGYHAAGLALLQRVVNADLLTDDWLGAVFAAPEDAPSLSATLFELNDPRQFFEPNGPASAQAGLGLDPAGALLLPMPPKVCRQGVLFLLFLCVFVCVGRMCWHFVQQT